MILITGANGFIGSALAAELNRRGSKDLLLTDYVEASERPKLLENIEYKQFLHPDKLLEDDNLFNEIKIVFHMGACSSTTETDWDYLKKVNLEYSKSLYNICLQQKIPFIYASSAATYGDGQMGFDDKMTTDNYTPLNLYGKSKLEFDIWMEENASNKALWAGFRFFNVFGPNEYYKQNMASIAFKAYHQIIETKKLKLFKSHNPEYKDGEQLRDFVYIKDITQWLLEVPKNQNFKSGIYNMGYGTAKTWLDLAKQLFKSLGYPLNIEWIDIPENIRDQYQYYTQADMEKFYSQNLGTAKWPLEDAVHDYVTQHLMAKEKTY